jgi:hypothetical protein
MTTPSRFLDSSKFNGLPEGRYVVPVVRVNGHETDIGQGQVIPAEFLEPHQLTFDQATGILTIGGRSIDLGEQDRFYIDCKSAPILNMTNLVTCSNLTEIIDASTDPEIDSGLKLQTPGNMFSGIKIRLHSTANTPSGLRLSAEGIAIASLDVFNLLKQYLDIEYTTPTSVATIINSIVPAIVTNQLETKLTAGTNIQITLAPGGEIVISSTAPVGTVTSVTLTAAPSTPDLIPGTFTSFQSKQINLVAFVNGVQGTLPILEMNSIFKDNAILYSLMGLPMFYRNLAPNTLPGPGTIVFLGQPDSIYRFGSGNTAGPFTPDATYGTIVTSAGAVDDYTGPFTIGRSLLAVTALEYPILFSALISPAGVAVYRNGILVKIARLVVLNEEGLTLNYVNVPLARLVGGVTIPTV